MSRKKKEKNKALAMIELCSIAQGILACDIALKKSSITLVWSQAFQPGKYAFLIQGGEEEVKDAIQAAQIASDTFIIDALVLTQPHEQIYALLGIDSAKNSSQSSSQSIDVSFTSKARADYFDSTQKDTLGIIETYGLVANLRAADAALKESDIQGLELSFSPLLGGKACFVFCGKLEAVQASLQKGVAQAPKNLIMHHQCIARPDSQLKWQFS
jgi:microcompartment protein CcmL/EutN